MKLTQRSRVSCDVQQWDSSFSLLHRGAPTHRPTVRETATCSELFLGPLRVAPRREQSTQTDRESHDSCTCDTHKEPFVLGAVWSPAGFTNPLDQSLPSLDPPWAVWKRPSIYVTGSSVCVELISFFPHPVIQLSALAQNC